MREPWQNFAELLHSERAPPQHGGTPQAERLDEVIGWLGRAGERAGQDLGMGDEEMLTALNGLPRELLEWLWLPACS